MMETTLPRKLLAGDEIRVIAPARSRALVMEHDNTRWIDERFAAMGLALSYGAHVDEDDDVRSSSIDSRVADLHDAFADPAVAGVVTVIGGFNSNELLPHIDWELIRRHPKILCGYSDITALQNAMLARANLVTYSGPHWSTFGMRDHFEPTGRWFRDCLFETQPLQLRPSAAYTDDLWFLDQEDRTPRPHAGWVVLQHGEAQGRIVGGNLCTLNLLQGTEFMPSLDGCVLFLEDDERSNPTEFARDLTSLLQLPDAALVRGLVLGRFQDASAMSRDSVAQIVGRQPVLAGKPVVWGLDFGHTNPMLTFPVGGDVAVSTSPHPVITITRH